MLNKTNLCSIDELKQLIGSSNVSVVDGSWFMPAANIDSMSEFVKKRIHGAVFFDIDKVCDTKSSLPHMLPGKAQFEEAVTALGIENTDRIVVYDTAGLFSAARVWWMFKLFGHHNVQVLDGGLPAWCDAEGAIESGEPTAALSDKKPYIAAIDETFLADKDVLIKNIQTGEYLVLDARSTGRFTAEEAEPRPGLQAGHMPRSKSLPFDRLINRGRLKSVAELTDVFKQLGLDSNHDDQAIVTSCGSGVTAAIITLALSEAGFAMHKLYDGAWAEWASAEDTTILQGE